MKNPEREHVLALIAALADAEGLSADQCVRQCDAESTFRQFRSDGTLLKSPSGAIGLFQLLPATAKDLGVNPARWHENVFGGLKYMGFLTRKYDGDKFKALAAYNFGPGALDRCIANYGDNWRANLPEETRKYLKRITE